MSGTERPSQRADARRNRERLLDAAREAFARDGVETSLNDIARRTGVGPATLYRHFPTRPVLLEALLAERYQELAAHATEARADRSAVLAWLGGFIAHLMAYRGLATSMRTALQDEDSTLYSSCHQMQAAWRGLVERAQREGVLSADVTSSELLRLANAIAWTTEELPDRSAQADRLLVLMFDGVAGR